MGYSLSFAEDFFTDEGYDEGRVREMATVTRRPQSVMQAIVSEEKLAPARFRRMVEKVLGYSLPAGQPADEAVFWDLLEAARKHNYCSSLRAPIDVYLNDDHYVTVYEDIEEEVA